MGACHVLYMTESFFIRIFNPVSCSSCPSSPFFRPTLSHRTHDIRYTLSYNVTSRMLLASDPGLTPSSTGPHQKHSCPIVWLGRSNAQMAHAMQSGKRAYCGPKAWHPCSDAVSCECDKCTIRRVFIAHNRTPHLVHPHTLWNSSV